MYLRYHFLSCVILSLILFPFLSYYSLLVFVFGFFIDVDHYLYYLIKNGKFDLFENYNAHMSKERIAHDQLHIFHTLEFITSFIFITIYSDNIYLLLMGMGFILHLILDEIDGINLIRSKVEIKQTRARSLIMWLSRNIS